MNEEKKVKLKANDFVNMFGAGISARTSRLQLERLKNVKYKGEPIVQGDSDIYRYQILAEEIKYVEM